MRNSRFRKQLLGFTVGVIVFIAVAMVWLQYTRLKKGWKSNTQGI